NRHVRLPRAPRRARLRRARRALLERHRQRMERADQPRRGIRDRAAGRRRRRRADGRLRRTARRHRPGLRRRSHRSLLAVPDGPRPREGLTVVVGWPPGHVAHASALRRAGWVVADYWPLSLPLLALVWGGFVWWAFGRDPGSKPSVKPEYAPPPDLIPAEAGALVDERAHPRDVIATVVDLAVRGYLEIEPITTAFGEADFMFKRLKPVTGDPDLRPFELFVLAKIFGVDWVINMRLLSEVRRDYENVFPPIRDQLYRMMVRDGLFPASPGSVRKGWMLAGALTAISATLLPTFGPAWLGRYDPMLPIGVVASGLIFIGWAWFMPRKTWAGVQVLARVRGFQEFCVRAE